MLVDKTDLKILEILQDNCRISLRDIARSVGLSSPSVVERIRKLEKKGILRGYRAIVDARKVGKDITAFIGVSVSHPQQIGSFEKEIEKVEDILECHHVTGDHTFMLKVKTENTSTLENLIRQIRSIEGVTRTLTSVVLSTPIEKTALHFNSQVEE
ncbi:MAG: Lrp/AsnC family transcriptional regulator [Candidatus Tectomicrobia bacterium]|uniref:Lrp/AsnC family transcriptional regulator n=1 Tax=Tectimicrobiota bacterium TaxID=2528274 RepID=A0A932GNA5_UNCTE|nr:Lrp/AsnC family transcriptional regulator [Candidatus Tectomicrobia bacterium]